MVEELRGQRSTGRVLVVDDDPDILDALSEILEVEGYEVQRARNGREALERLEQMLPDVVLLDLMMPVMDGWEFARSLSPRPPADHRLSADRTCPPGKEIGWKGGMTIRTYDVARDTFGSGGAHPDVLTRRVARRYGPARAVDWRISLEPEETNHVR
jgi:hypothetical protein